MRGFWHRLICEECERFRVGWMVEDLEVAALSFQVEELATQPDVGSGPELTGYESSIDG